jgi:dethiobiotin synthetase
MTRLVVTGTGTGVGITIVTAAIAAVAAAQGRSVVVVKPAQTGVVPGEESDTEVVRRLAGIEAVHELIRYGDPLAPASAARRDGVHPATVGDLAAKLDAEVLVVTTAGLGTLNATALTVEALRHRSLACAGVVIGEWPATAGLAERCNLTDLPSYAGAPLLGAIPAGAGTQSPEGFARTAATSLAPELGGTWSVPVEPPS